MRIAETELVLICDCDRSGDHNCHWPWDAGDFAKSMTGWCVFPLQPYSYFLFLLTTVHGIDSRELSVISFLQFHGCVTHEEIINVFLFATFPRVVFSVANLGGTWSSDDIQINACC